MKDQADFNMSKPLRWWQTSTAPWVVLCISLLLTAAAWHFSNRYLADRADERFAFRVTQSVNSIKGRMLDYEQVLLGGAGLFYASPSVSRQQWHDYVTHAQIVRNYPGIQSIAVDFPISANQKAAHIAQVRAEGFSDYSIKPALPERQQYHSLVYIEPFSERNQRAFGFDMYTNPVRRVAMDRAIEQGLPSISGMVKLAQETDQDVQYGFIFCVPVYQSGMPLNNPSQRHAALRALVSAGFRANDLMHGIFDRNTHDLELEVFDDGKISEATRLYSSLGKNQLIPSRFSSNVPIEVGGRKWLLRISANQSFLTSVASIQSSLIAGAGILLNCALFVSFLSLTGRERKAHLLANEMMRDLYDKEAHFSRIIASSNEAIVSKRLDGEITDWNPAAEKMFGYRSDEVLGCHISSILKEQPTQAEAQLMQRIAQGEQIEHFEAQYQTKQGSWIDVVVSLSIQRDANGIVVGATRFMRDISERKRAEQKFFELQYQMLQWVEELPIGLFVVNQNGQPHYANQRAIAILGQGIMPNASQEQLSQLYQIYREDSNQLYPNEALPVVQALAGKSCMVDDLEVAVEGVRRKLQVWGKPVLSASGVVEFGVAAFEDITERKLALAIQAHYADIVASSNDMIMSTDLAGTITGWNPAAERVFGYHMTQVMGQSAFMLIPSERQAEESMLLARLARGEYIEHLESVRVRQDGSKLDVSMNLSPMKNNAGQVIGVSVVMSNISQRKQVDRLKSEFVSTVSHELRTPLTSIRGSLGLIMGGAIGPVPERAASLLNIASNNCERLVRLINDILDVEKLEAGKYQFEFRRHDLTSLVNAVVQNNQTYADQFGVTFVVIDDPGVVYVRVDAERVMQVLANLLSNAAKFSHRDQEVEISIQRQAPHEVKVSVRDHGVGIPEDFKARIFQKFAQADSSDTRKIQRGGTGLGLSIAKAIVEQQGGYMGFSSEEGKGSCFYFVLQEDISDTV